MSKREAQLERALTLALDIIRQEVDNGRTPPALQGVGLGYFEDVLAGDPNAKLRNGDKNDRLYRQNARP